MDQRINLKFLVKLGKRPAECLKLLKEVYGEHVMSKTQVYEWHKRFKSGREEVEDDHKSGRPSTAKTPDNINRVNKLVRSDRRLTVRMMAEYLSMKRESVRTILVQDLGMHKVCAKEQVMDAPPRQRARSHRAQCEAVIGQETGHSS